MTPKIYLVFWGWGQPGAFDHTTPGFPANDPDGAAARMTGFVKALGGTAWTGSQTQYYELVNGQEVHIQNPTDQFGGVWYDDTNPIHNDVTGLELAQEAQRAVAHFEQLGHRQPGELRRLGAQEELAGLAIDHHVSERAGEEPVAAALQLAHRGAVALAAQLLIGVVKLRKVEVANCGHGVTLPRLRHA